MQPDRACDWFVFCSFDDEEEEDEEETFAFLHVYFNILKTILSLIVTTLEGSNTKQETASVKPNVGDVW